MKSITEKMVDDFAVGFSEYLGHDTAMRVDAIRAGLERVFETIPANEMLDKIEDELKASQELIAKLNNKISYLNEMYVITPIIPTKEMINAFNSTNDKIVLSENTISDGYQSMLSAAPKIEEMN